MRGVMDRGKRNSEVGPRERGVECSADGWAVIPTGGTLTAWSTGEVRCVGGLAYIGVLGVMVSGISSDLMAWLELHNAALRGIWSRWALQVVHRCEYDGNRSDIQGRSGAGLESKDDCSHLYVMTT